MRQRKVRRDVGRKETPLSRNLTNYRLTGAACVMLPAARKRERERESGADMLEISAILIPGAEEEKESARSGTGGQRGDEKHAPAALSAYV